MSTERPTRDYPSSRGAAAIGARLRRLSERIDRDTARIYALHKEAFEQRWFGPFNQIRLRGQASVGEIAATLGVTHVAVSQACAGLLKAKLVRPDPDPADARRRQLTLTAKGAALAERMTPLWDRLEAVSREVEAEVGGLLAKLDLLEQALDRESLTDRFERLSRKRA